MKLFKIKYLYLLVGCLVLLSCNNEDDIKEETIPEYLIVEDSTRETEYDYTILNPSDDYVNFIKVNDDGLLTEMNILYDNYSSKAVAQFYDNGLVKSVGTDAFTLVFSNYVDDKVDVVVITESETETLYGLQMNVDWDIFTQNSSRAISERQKEALIYWGKLVKTNYEFIANGILGNVNPLLYLGGIVANSVEFIVVEDSELKHTLSVVEFSAALAAGALKWTGPWGVFFTILLNYDDYRDWVADEVYNFMMLVDKLTPKVEEGAGALLRIAVNSYEETLPAIHNEGKVTFTLSTNITYTQMGTDVKEWGVALFKGNELVEKYPVSKVSEKTQLIDFSFDITKEQFNLDYDDYIAIPKDEWYLKAYEINNQNPNIPIFGRSKTILDLVYNQKPSITMYDLTIGKTVDINEGYWTKLTYYSYKWVLTGSLFMDDAYIYYAGKWTDSGKGKSITLWDGKYQSGENTGVKYAPNSNDAYIYYLSVVDGEQIKSSNYLHFYMNQNVMNISLVEGNVKSKSKSFNDKSVMDGSTAEFLSVRVIDK
jgi:hypothetical protein